MPNWCENTLRIIPENDAARALLPQITERFKSSDNTGNQSAFQLIHPMPSELEGTTAPSSEENWYDWRIANWGTKWEESSPFVIRSGDYELLVSFQTAWAPPLGIYQRLVKLGFDVLATYAEQGIGFAGYWINGKDRELTLEMQPDADGEYPEDFEVLRETFAGHGIPEELFPPGLGG